MRSPGRLALLALAACNSQAPGVLCPDGSCVYEESSSIYEISTPRPFDLLVVMDDSASMAAQQDDLVARLAPDLDKIPGGAPELRVRVISSSVPAPGLSGFPGCAPAEPRTCVPPGSYLEATQVCGQHSTFTGPLSEAFRCAASVGTAGCGWEQPLAAARAALEGDPQDGSRFLRRDAYLLILIVTDEDDCSAPAGSPIFGAPPSAPDDPALAYRCHERAVRCAGRPLSELTAGADLADCLAADDADLVPVGDYVQFFSGLKARPYQVAVSVLAGWPSTYGLVETAAGRTVRPECERNGSPVLPAVRLRAFVEAFEDRGALIDLCTPGQSVDAALQHLGERLAVRLSDPCLPEGLLDGDPALPGVQPTCTVTETTLDPAGDQPIAARPLPRCDSGAPAPCWRAREDAACFSGFRAPIERGCRVGAPTLVTFRCATAPNR
jgi:hypothetical protein